MSRLSKFWRLWAKSLGEKNGTTDKDSDKVAILRTIVVLVNFFTCFVIVAGVITIGHDECIFRIRRRQMG